MKVYQIPKSETDVNSLDNGNYTCEVRGDNYTLLGSTTHYVYIKYTHISRLRVRATTVKTILLVYNNELRSNQSNMKVHEGQPVAIKCISFGGYPETYLQIIIGKRDVTSFFHLKSSVSLLGSVGLRQIMRKDERWTRDFV
ncbi:hypothetical protein HELRODRAFT_178158 [Helobdella robusta]|uniref:Uncharacterized protein n=1 Tax=Helobdella robusta TaxID=6412 RepID=T1FCU8_HELRO|nr:hypothetical protein HELRODRAFT_178158 [Helobdella robusta]ESN97369.1 hypothetical protein HELRODRAFT_178158 [Helobdella robusta]